MDGRRASRAGTKWLGSRADGPWHTEGAGTRPRLAARRSTWPFPTSTCRLPSASRPRRPAAAVRPAAQVVGLLAVCDGAAGGLLPGADHHAGATGPCEAPAASHPGLPSWWKAGVWRCPKGDTPHAHTPRGGWLDHHSPCVPVSRGRRRGTCREGRVGGGGTEAEEYRPDVEVGPPLHRDHARSYRSRLMTLSHAATKSRTNSSSASLHA
jgi:hypothetical protein